MRKVLIGGDIDHFSYVEVVALCQSDFLKHKKNEDKFAANYYGMKLKSYLRFKKTAGRIACIHPTKKGDLCRNFVCGTNMQCSPRDWQVLEKLPNHLCIYHGGLNKEETTAHLVEARRIKV